MVGGQLTSTPKEGARGGGHWVSAQGVTRRIVPSIGNEQWDGERDQILGGVHQVLLFLGYGKASDGKNVVNCCGLLAHVQSTKNRL